MSQRLNNVINKHFRTLKRSYTANLEHLSYLNYLYADDIQLYIISHQPITYKPSRVWKPAYKMRKHGSVTMDLWWMTTCTTTSPQSIASRRGVLLVLIDLSAAFDTINHTPLLRRLSGYGISGDVLAWLASYLCNRTCVVRVMNGVSEVETMTTGVPHGTVLGPLLVNAYIALLTTLLQKHNIHHHLYADDTQLYITFPPTDHTQTLARMEACIQEAKAWLYDNVLLMNHNKAHAIVIVS